MSADLDADFKRAVAVVADPKSANLFTDSTKLNFYALYKQAMDGDIPADRACPSVFQVVARAKHKAWEDLKGTSRDDAKLAYIKNLQGSDPTFMTTPKPAQAKAEVIPEAEAVSEGKTNGRVAQDEISVTSPTSNVMFMPALLGCAAMVGLGVAGFLFTTLSWTALFFLGLSIAGIGGLVGSILLMWDEHGLIAILPSFLHKILFDMTLLEFIIEDKFLVEVKAVITQILPTFLAKDEAKMYATLSAMSPRLRQVLTTKGMVRMLSKQTQRILLPRVVRQQLLTQPPSYRLPPGINTDPGKLVQAVNQGKPSDRPDLDRARELFSQMFAEVMSKRNTEMILAWLNPKVLQKVAMGLSAATLVQLAISSESRKFFVGFVRGLLLLVSMVGAGASGGLFLLWAFAKRQQKRLGN